MEESKFVVGEMYEFEYRGISLSTPISGIRGLSLPSRKILLDLISLLLFTTNR